MALVKPLRCTFKRTRKTHISKAHPASPPNQPPPQRNWVKGAALANRSEGTFTLDDIRRYILKRYPQVNESTVSTQVNYCCVNRPSRTNTPANQEPRIANGHYDILFAESRNCYAKYDPQKHGVWDIAQISGKFVVRNVTGATTNHETEQVKQPQKSKTRQIGNRVLTGLMPSARSVSEYADKWCALDNYPAQESALHKLFHECFPTNTDLDGALFTTGEGIQDAAGPIGVVQLVAEQTRTGGLETFLNLAVIISINLGLVNLLPIPGLDGSRLVFFLIEAIRRKPVSRKIETAVHLTGYALLLGLMAFFTFQDVGRLLGG